MAALTEGLLQIAPSPPLRELTRLDLNEDLEAQSKIQNPKSKIVMVFLN